MAMSSTNSWLKVAAGARLVASAFVQKSTSDAATAAQRIAHHGGDLSSKASHAASILPSAEIVSVFYEQAMTLYQQSRIQEHDDVTTTSTTVKAGTAPYESQLRRKRERSQPNYVQQQQQKVVPTDSQSSSSNVDEYSAYLFHSKNNKIERSVTSEFERDSMGAFSSTLEASASSSIASQPQILPTATTDNDDTMNPRRHLEEGQAVPSTRIGRAFGFAKLGAGLLWGTAGEWTSRLVQGSSNSSSSAITTDANADRLAATLCRMRGAALKMGQMLSIQDESLLPPALTRALQQVRQGAEAMPQYQLHKQLSSQLGSDWREKFHTFEERPFAAASIGQVHYATVRDQTTGQVIPVVVKVQYPGVALSIESDLGNLAMLVKMTGLAPKGLFIENVIRVGRDELKVECNYLNELANQESFQTLVKADPILRDNNFVVPDVFEDLTTEQILTTAYARGGTIDKVSHLDQDERNRIGRTILYLTMQELFEWRLMQTDPNWGNFLYDAETRTTTLIDFGATREFPKSFVDGYLRIVWASANRDEEVLMAQSHKMNFLTGEENETMLNAHKLSGFTVGEPFWRDEPFDFRGSQISSRMSEHTSVFLRHRLTPPPEEVYTLHRKLAGAYMLCIKLGSVIQCRDMLEAVVANHIFEDGMPNPNCRTKTNAQPPFQSNLASLQRANDYPKSNQFSPYCSSPSFFTATFGRMPSISLVLSATGVILLLHSAYSCMHYRSLLQDMDLLQDDNHQLYPIPPMDVYVEVALSFVMILFGELLGMGKLQTVDVFSSQSTRKPLVAPPYRTRDFDIYNNRSKMRLEKSS